MTNGLTVENKRFHPAYLGKYVTFDHIEGFTTEGWIEGENEDFFLFKRGLWEKSEISNIIIIENPPEKKVAPKPKKIVNIYSEGYACTGESSGAMWHAAVEANSFREAVLKHAEENPKFKQYLSSHKKQYTYWGCRLFDNLEDAQKSFG